MSAPPHRPPKRERMRSRCLVPAAALALLSGCSDALVPFGAFGAGVAELPATQGWRPLPIANWVINDGIAPRTMVFCPRETCASQGFATLIEVAGRPADDLERALAADPARLAREFTARASPPRRTATGTPPRPAPAKSATTVSRFAADEGASGLLVEIAALGGEGKRAAAVILSGREAGRLVVALAVSPDAGAARRNAGAIWRSR